MESESNDPMKAIGELYRKNLEDQVPSVFANIEPDKLHASQMYTWKGYTTNGACLMKYYDGVILAEMEKFDKTAPIEIQAGVNASQG